MGRRTRLISVVTPEPTVEEKLQYLNAAAQALRDDDVNKLVSTIPLGVDVKNVYNFKFVNSRKRLIHFQCSLLHLSIINQSNNCAKFLLHVGAPKEEAESFLGDLPLHTAVRFGSREAVSLLLEYGAQPTSCNKMGDTALHISARKGDLLTTQLLLQKGAEASVQNRYGETPCFVACVTGTPSSLGCVDLIRSFPEFSHIH